MRRSLAWTFGLAALALSVAVMAGPPKNVFFHDGDKVDLAELEDGETRTFGSGDDEITATREGDVVTLSFGESSDRVRNVKCSVDEDHCFVVTAGDGAATKVMIMKSHEGGGIHSKDANVFVMGADHAVEGFAWVDEDGNQTLHVGEGHECGHGEHAMVRVEMARGAMLQCPEGDATLHLEEGESAEGFYCPKHNILMEEVERKHHNRMLNEIIIHSGDEDE